MCLESACLHCLQGMGFPCPQLLPTGSIVSYSLFVPIFVLSSSMFFELWQFSDFHCGHFLLNSRWRPDAMSVVFGTKFNMKLYITMYMGAKFRAFVKNTF